MKNLRDKVIVDGEVYHVSGLSYPDGRPDEVTLTHASPDKVRIHLSYTDTPGVYAWIGNDGAFVEVDGELIYDADHPVILLANDRETQTIDSEDVGDAMHVLSDPWPGQADK